MSILSSTIVVGPRCLPGIVRTVVQPTRSVVRNCMCRYAFAANSVAVVGRFGVNRSASENRRAVLGDRDN